MRKTFTTTISLYIIVVIIALSTTAVFGQVISDQDNSIQVEDFQVDRTIVDAGSTASVNVKLANPSNYVVSVRVGIPAPANVQGSVKITGGDGNLVLTAGETKTATLQITNTGNLAQDTTVTFVLTVDGGGQPVTQQFQLTFIRGLGERTTLTIKTIDGSTQELIPSATVECAYGVNNENSKLGSTSNDAGTATFDLGTYTGEVQVTASAPSRYQNQTQIITVNSGDNNETFYLNPEQGTTTDPENNQTNWVPYGIAFGVAAIIIGVPGYLILKKKREKIE